MARNVNEKRLRKHHKTLGNPTPLLMLSRVPQRPQYGMHKVQLDNPRKRRKSEYQTLQPAQSLLHISKKQKKSHNNGSQFPPAFWDNLSKIYLTRRALKELDRRNSQADLDSRPNYQQLHRAILAKVRKTSQTLTLIIDYLRHCGGIGLQSIKRTARHGGPDLSDLRGVSQPCIHWS